MKLTKKWREYNEDQIKKGKSPEPKFPVWLEFIYRPESVARIDRRENEVRQTSDKVEDSREETV